MRPLPHRIRLIASLALFAALAGCHAVEPGETDDENEPMASTGCGTERWSVKTGTDADIGLVNQAIEDTTIGTLNGFPTQSNLPSNNRIAPYETQVYRLTNVSLSYFASESDSDYHLAVKDSTGAHMIVESALPTCVSGSTTLLQGITAARNDVHVGTSSGTVTVIGVGFFDFQHGQTGVAPNAFELHPILGICYGADCTIVGPTPTPSGTPLPTPSATPSGTGTPAPTPTPGGNGVTAGSGCGCDLAETAALAPAGPAVLLLLAALGTFRRRRTNPSPGATA